MSVTVGGITHSVPGAYGDIKVENAGASAIPAFNGLLVIANARQGIPVSAGDGSVVIQQFSDLKSVKKCYGVGDLSNAVAQNQVGGANVVYTITPAPLTRATLPMLDGATTPLPIFNLAPAIYGAPGNDIQLVITNDSTNIGISVTPPKYTKFLTADLNSTGSKTLSLDDVSQLSVGDQVYCTANGVTPVYTSATITSIDDVLNQVTLDTTIQSLTQANYARLFSPDVNNKKSTTILLALSNVLSAVLNFFNSTGIFVASRDITNTGSIATIAPVNNFLGLLVHSPATLGTSPIATTTTNGDWATLAGSLPQLMEEFTNFTKNRIRILNVISPIATLHSTFSGIAKILRKNQYSVLVITGADKGDVLKTSTDAGHPINRAKALNSSDVALAGIGLDGNAAYLSLAPQFAGMLSSNSVGRNFTKDSITANSVEKTFGEFNKETDSTNYVNNSVLIVSSTKNGFEITQAINTYQNHGASWNEDDNASFLIHQVQIIDYVYEGFHDEMETLAGSDNLTLTNASTKGIDCLDGFIAEGVITDRKISIVPQGNNALMLTPEVTPINSEDFIGFDLLVNLKSN